MAEKKSGCGCGCALKQEAGKAPKNPEAKDADKAKKD
jgi:hypothetical protein